MDPRSFGAPANPRLTGKPIRIRSFPILGTSVALACIAAARLSSKAEELRQLIGRFKIAQSTRTWLQRQLDSFPKDPPSHEGGFFASAHPPTGFTSGT